MSASVLWCPTSGTVVDADRTDGSGLLWCPTCHRYACTEATDRGPAFRLVERHRFLRAVTVRTIAPGDQTPIQVRLPRDGRLTRAEATDLRAQLAGVLHAGHPLDHDHAQPVDALEPF